MSPSDEALNSLPDLAEEFDLEVWLLFVCSERFIDRAETWLYQKPRRPSEARIKKDMEKISKALDVDCDTVDYLHQYNGRVWEARRLLMDAAKKFRPECVIDTTPREQVALIMVELCGELNIEISSYQEGFLCRWLEILRPDLLQFTEKFDSHEMAKMVVRFAKERNSQT